MRIKTLKEKLENSTRKLLAELFFYSGSARFVSQDMFSLASGLFIFKE